MQFLGRNWDSEIFDRSNLSREFDVSPNFYLIGPFMRHFLWSYLWRRIISLFDILLLLENTMKIFLGSLQFRSNRVVFSLGFMQSFCWNFSQPDLELFSCGNLWFHKLGRFLNCEFGSMYFKNCVFKLLRLSGKNFIELKKWSKFPNFSEYFFSIFFYG